MVLARISACIAGSRLTEELLPLVGSVGLSCCKLVKTPALFERDKQERQVAEADLQWLGAVAR
jgi:hypothetical protein